MELASLARSQPSNQPEGAADESSSHASTDISLLSALQSANGATRSLVLRLRERSAEVAKLQSELEDARSAQKESSLVLQQVLRKHKQLSDSIARDAAAKVDRQTDAQNRDSATGISGSKGSGFLQLLSFLQAVVRGIPGLIAPKLTAAFPAVPRLLAMQAGVIVLAIAALAWMTVFAPFMQQAIHPFVSSNSSMHGKNSRIPIDSVEGMGSWHPQHACGSKGHLREDCRPPSWWGPWEFNPNSALIQANSLHANQSGLRNPVQASNLAHPACILCSAPVVDLVGAAQTSVIDSVQIARDILRQFAAI